MAIEFPVQRLQIGDVVALPEQGSEVEATVAREIDRTELTVRVTLRVEGREDFIKEWPIGEMVTVVRTRPPLDSARGAEVARKLKALGVKGPLITAAKAGFITEMRCEMPKCFCCEKLGGRGYFVPRTPGQWSDWEPTFEHFPISKLEGGGTTPDNAVLAHRLCNKLDHFIRKGLSIEQDLARVRKACEEAAGNMERRTRRPS